MSKFQIGKLIVAILVGILVGIGMFTFQYAEGISYFKKDPEACANCHIMQPQLDSWRKSSHHTVAVCVDCHLPSEFFAKYISKADNGYRHSKGFTLQDFHEPIAITEQNSIILQENCIRCHQPIVHQMYISGPMEASSGRCVHCHRDVGHGEFVGLGGFE